MKIFHSFLEFCRKQCVYWEQACCFGIPQNLNKAFLGGLVIPKGASCRDEIGVLNVEE